MHLPKDIRKLIYAKLDKYDIKLILKAHGSKEPILDGISWHCAKNGHLELLKWARDNNCPYDVWVCAGAAMNGHLEVLKYLHENGYEWDAWACTRAAKNGHLEILKYLHANGCLWDKSECVLLATQNDHQHIIDWLNAN